MRPIQIWYYLLLLLLLPLGIWAQDDAAFPPKPVPLQPVNDYGNVLSAQEESQLSAKLQSYDRQSSTTIIIVTVPSLGGYDVAQYATELGNRWQIGRKGKDNGVVILAAIEDRKINISTGRGVEGALPDITIGQIIRKEISPAFKAGDYYGGFSKGANAVIKATQGEYVNENPDEGARGESSPGSSIILLFIILIVVMMLMRNGGNGGGGGGTYMSRRGRRSWMPPVIIGGGFGGGGFGGGGFGGGGGDFGGGFGGSGGGSFGGGGASGDW